MGGPATVLVVPRQTESSRWFWFLVLVDQGTREPVPGNHLGTTRNHLPKGTDGTVENSPSGAGLTGHVALLDETPQRRQHRFPLALRRGAYLVASERIGRELTVSELLLLPRVLSLAIARSQDFPSTVDQGLAQREARQVTLASLFPPDASVSLGPAAVATGATVIALLEGREVADDALMIDEGSASLVGADGTVSAVRVSRPAVSGTDAVWPSASEEQRLLAAVDALREVEQRTATRLGVRPLLVSLAARRMWGHGVTAERDRRLEGQPAGRAGAVTRTLTTELQSALEAAGVIRPAKKKARKETRRGSR